MLTLSEAGTRGAAFPATGSRRKKTEMSMMDGRFEELLARVRGEYLEMPGLHLTVPQAVRLLALDAGVCDALFSRLVASGFLRRTAKGAFALAGTEWRTAGVVPPPTPRVGAEASGG